MQLFNVRPGTCCKSCGVLAWGGERWHVGRLGVWCVQCWDRGWHGE